MSSGSPQSLPSQAPWLPPLLRRIATGIVFLGIVAGVMGGAHYYLYARLALEPAWPGPLRALVAGALVLGLASIVLQGIPHARRSPWARRLAFGAYTWMGFLFYVFLATVALDLIEGAARLGGLHTGEPDAETRLARLQAALVVVVSGLATHRALEGGKRMPQVRPIEVEIEGLAPAFDGFRIVQISDIHIGPLLDRTFSQWLTDSVNALAPDLVAVTGDLVDGSVSRLEDDVEPFHALRAPHGVYFVTGNHDFYSGAESWTEQVQRFGWQALRNRNLRIESNGQAFVLAGVDDPHGSMVEGMGGEDLDAALAGAEDGPPVVLLAHDPSTFKRARSRRVALQLSGHTHGGQIWPFHLAVRLAGPWVAGHYEEQGSQLYVSCGTGFWGPPMRLGTRSEITEITLRSARARA